MSSSPVSSIQGRVLAGTGLAVAVTLLAAGSALYGLVREGLVREVDRTLREKAHLLASLVEADEDELDLEDLRLVEREPLFLAVWRGAPQAAHGAPLYRTSNLGPAELGPAPVAADAETIAWVALPGGDRGRALTLSFRPRLEHGRARAADHLTLVLARDTRELDATLATLLGLLVGVGLVTLLVAGGVLLLVVRRSLRPLAVVAEEIAAIDAERLDARLPVDAPAELRAAVVRVNELLGRLEAAFARERAFSSEVAHELRTPLAGLRTTLEVAGARPRTAEEYQAALGDGLTLAQQLSTMVERLLQLARLETGATPAPAPVALGEAVLEAWKPCAAPAATRGLQVAWELDPELEVSADPALLELVLRNLLENAVSYADPGGRVRIAALAAGDDALLEVENTGSALGQDEVAQATRRFWRKDAARSQAGHHCGLGLSLVQRAVQALGGRLTLTSRVGGPFLARVELARGAGATAPAPRDQPVPQPA